MPHPQICRADIKSTHHACVFTPNDTRSNALVARRKALHQRDRRWGIVALFAFCVACSCYNLLAAIKGALRGVHGYKTVEELSNFYLTNEISGVYRGMMIALPPEKWTVFQTMSQKQLADLLTRWARRVDLEKYRKASRGPKKPRPARPNAQFKHVATAKLLPKKRSLVRTNRPAAVVDGS